MTERGLFFAGALVAVVLAAGCNDKEEIHVYRLVKALPESSGMPAVTPEAQPGMGDERASKVPTTPPSASAITATRPSQWEPQPPSSMRQASFLVKGDNGAIADISLVALSGEAGGVLDNVNRWRSQLDQAPITADQLAQTVQRLTSPLGEVTVVELEGLPPGADPAKDGRIIAAIVSSGTKTLFFKMRGNSALVGTQKDDFIKWVGSVCSLEANAGPTAPPAAADAALDSGKPPIKWGVPGNWRVVPASSMRYASFAVSSQNGEAGDISVIVFPGEGGGDLDNVNRWRQQIGLPAVEAGQLKSLVVPLNGRDAGISMVDLTGADAGVLAAWVRHDGRAWFFKLSGPNRLVTSERANFITFLQSVQFQP